MGPLPQSPFSIEEGVGERPLFIIKVLCKHSIQAVLNDNILVIVKKNCIEIP